MKFVLRRLLSRSVRFLTAAPADSWRGRFTAALKSVLREHLADASSLAEFGDLSEHERMLADRARVDTYAAGIAAAIGPDDVVVDLGAGSGILTFLAARQAKKVYAVEHSDMIEIARHVGSANGVENVEYLHCHSRDFDPLGGVDVILHEQIGDELFDENMIENVVDLRERVLRPGGRILPADFELFLEPVQLLESYRIPQIWQMELHGIDFTSLESAPVLDKFRRSWDSRFVNRSDIEWLLAEPAPIMVLDLMTVAVEDEVGPLRAERVITRAGELDGLLLYFRVLFDGGAALETGPDRVSSWGTRLFKVPPRSLVPGDVLSYELDLPDILRPETWTITRCDHRAAPTS